MKTRSAAVVVACVWLGASACGPGLEPPKASSGGIPRDGVDHGMVPGAAAGSAAGLAGTGAASAADAGALPSKGGAGGSRGNAGQGGAAGSAGNGGDAGIDDDAGN